MKHTADISFIGTKVAHEHKHEYDSPDIFGIGIAVHADKTNVMKHTADINYIGMKVAHELKHEHDSPKRVRKWACQPRTSFFTPSK